MTVKIKIFKCGYEKNRNIKNLINGLKDKQPTIIEEDKYDYVSPEVSVVETSNYEDELINKLHAYYNEYLEEINTSYSDNVKKEDWYQNMLKQITWNSDGKGFSDTSGYKQFITYVLVKLV